MTLDPSAYATFHRNVHGIVVAVLGAIVKSFAELNRARLWSVAQSVLAAAADHRIDLKGIRPAGSPHPTRLQRARNAPISRRRPD